MALQATCKDSVAKTNHVVLVIEASFGVCTTELPGIQLSVVGNGRMLSCALQWPQHSMDMDTLHAVLIDEATAKGGNHGSNDELHDVCKHLEALSDELSSMGQSDSEVLSSKAIIPLPTQVSTRKMNKVHLLGGHDGSRILCVDLKSED